MKRTGRVYPRVSVDSIACRAVGQAGGVLLTRTVDVAGLGGGLSTALARWPKRFAVHDPGKIVTEPPPKLPPNTTKHKTKQPEQLNITIRKIGISSGPWKRFRRSR